MNSTTNMTKPRTPVRVCPADARRGGAVIVIVLSLISAMAFLGFFFYSSTKFEGNASAQFAAVDTAEVDADAVIDHAMRQLIVGTPPEYTNSALYGSQYSMIAGVVGNILPDGTPVDTVAFNGGGIGVVRRTYPPGGSTDGLSRDVTVEDDDGRTPEEPGYTGGAPIDDRDFLGTTGAPDGIPDSAQIVGFDRNGDGRPDFYPSTARGANFRVPMNKSGSARIDDLIDADGSTHPHGFPSPFGTVNDPLIAIGPYSGTTGPGAAGKPPALYNVPTGPAAANAYRQALMQNAPGPTGQGSMYYEPDAGHTAADASSMFLGWQSVVELPAAGDRPLVVASFDRPGYFPDFRTRTAPAGILGFTEFFTQTVSPDGTYLVPEQTLFPHRDHLIAKQALTHPDVPRFIYQNPFGSGGGPLGLPHTLAVTGDDEVAALGGLVARSGDPTRVIPPFPFYTDLDGDGIANERGLYSYSNEPGEVFSPGSNNGFSDNQSVPEIEYPVDNDLDGIPDSLWMDLGHGIIELAAGRQVVPMYAFRVLDADALLNVNAHGNASGTLADPDPALTQGTADPLADTPHSVHPLGDRDGDGAADPISRSNMAFSRAEVNLGRAFTADPSSATYFEGNNSARSRLHGIYHGMFGSPPGGVTGSPGSWPAENLFLDATGSTVLPTIGRQAMSNMDLAMLLYGRPRPGDDRMLAGRYGEPSLMTDPFAQDDPAGGAATAGYESLAVRPGDGSTRYYAWLPQPGRTRFDGTLGSNPTAFPYPRYRGSNPVRPFDDDSDSNDPLGQLTDEEVHWWLKGDVVYSRGGYAYFDEDLKSDPTDTDGLMVPPAVHPVSPIGTGQTAFQNGQRVLVTPGFDNAAGGGNQPSITAAGDLDAERAAGFGDADHANESPVVQPGYRGLWQEQRVSLDSRTDTNPGGASTAPPAQTGTAAPFESDYANYTRTIRNVFAVTENGGLADMELDIDGSDTGTATNPNQTSTQTSALPPDAVPVLQPRAADLLANSPEELELDPEKRATGTNEYGVVDGVFEPSENGPLHLSDADVLRAGLASRLKELAPFSLSENRFAADIRRMLTTDSWDRLEFTAPPELRVGTNPDGYTSPRDWEYNAWTIAPDAANPFRQPASFPGVPLRPHVGLDGFEEFPNGQPDLGTPDPTELEPAEELFPPKFGTVGAAPFCFADEDPFRYELRRMLATPGRSLAFPGNALSPFTTDNLGPPTAAGGRLSPRHRLNLTRLLDGFDDHGNPKYRQLVPHVVINRGDTNDNFDAVEAMYHGQPLATPARVPGAYPAWTDMSDGDYTTPQAPAEKQAQDWWARYDRQRMARDIYVLLYTTCLPDDFNPTTESPSAAANAEVPRMVREFAQFAVNVVDAVDRDNVITRFEYDPDLSDGWSQDDLEGGSADLLAVNGIEAADLTISEGMYVFAEDEGGGSDVNAAAWDESEDRGFLFVKLRNVSPFDVNLWDGNYRLVAVDQSGNRVACASITHNNNRSFAAANGYDPSSLGSQTTDVLRIGPGANFVISCQDGTMTQDNGSSDIEMNVPEEDLTTAGGGGAITPILIKIVPNANATRNGNANPRQGVDVTAEAGAHLDLHYAGTEAPHSSAVPLANEVHSDAHSNYVRFDVSHPDATSDPSLIPAGSSGPASTELTIVLERRRQLDANNRLENGVDTLVIRPTTAGELADPGFSVNDWVEVDRVTLIPRNLPASAYGSGNEADYNVVRQALTSTTRQQPFAPFGTTSSTDTPGPTPSDDDKIRPWNHTFEEATRDGTGAGADSPDPQMHFPGSGSFRDESAAPPTFTAFTQWQPHFDRDMTSVAELLSIPLYGYASRDTNSEASFNSIVAGSTPRLEREGGPGAPIPGGGTNLYYEPGIAHTNRAAAGRILRTSDVADVNQNRMYRLLEFVTARVPHLDDSRSPRTREPGKINIGTLRDEEVLAAIIDDEVHLSGLDEAGATAYDPAHPTLDRRDRTSGTNYRNWFTQLLRHRDASPAEAANPTDRLPYFPAADAITRLPLPGMPSANGFRPMSSFEPVRTGGTAGEVDASLAKTLLAADTDLTNVVGGRPPEHFGLFDARSVTEQNDTAIIDLHTRNRILQKVMNHGTLRSNVFFVWVTVGLFEAHQPFAGNPELEYMVQIGGETDPSERYRYFFVIDRSKLEAAYVDEDPDDGLPGRFDHTKFILYSERLR